MRIHSVAMSGFGPFRDRVEVDFDAFADDGIFLLTGRTGAGKSSVLDALTYGLFGTVPRYEGRVDEAIRSRFLPPGEPTEVTVELTVADTRYRVWRSPAYRRPKKVGSGTTQEKARIELSLFGPSGFEVFETKIGNADTHVQELVGLDAHQFLQVVLLAQGQFQEFLLARSDTRRKLLRRLFGTQRFDAYATAVQDRAKKAKAELDRVLTTISAKAGTLAQQSGTEAPAVADAARWATTIVAGQRDVVEQATARAEIDRARLTAAEQRFQRARTTAERQQRRSDAEARLTLLVEQQPAVDGHRQTVVTARRAALAHQAVTAHRRCEESARHADQAHTAARDALERRFPDGSPEDLGATADELAERIGELSRAAELEARLPELRRRDAGASEVLATFDRDAEERRAERERAARRLDELRRELEDSSDLGAQHAAASAELARLRERQARAVEAEELQQGVTEAEREHLDLAEHANTVERRLNALRRRQLDGYAAVLAHRLVPGEPCAVCGATEHPEPARPSDDHVDTADIDAAELAEATARERQTAARATLDRRRTSLEEARRQADGTTEQLARSVREAAESVAELERSLSRRAALEAEARGLRASLDVLDVQLGDTAAERDRFATAATAARTTLADAERSVAAARGEADSVESIQLSLRHDLAAVRSCVEATQRLHECTEALVAARSALDAAIVEGGFASADDVEAALVPTDQVERLDDLVTQHQADLSAVRTILAEADLADLPDDPVDLDAPRRELEEARALASVSGDERATQQGRLEAFADLAAEVSEAADASAAQLARYETVAGLDQTLRGYGANQLRMPLETFALVAELEDILGAANVRLAAMTAGRYELQYSDDAVSTGTSGLEIAVLDAHTGDARSPSSLSGGEKFQTSLALALGLAEVVTSRAGGLRLDTLFIDEGFGSLDPETLEVTMETLDALREGGRTVGLISHVEAMKEQIPAQIRVERTSDGSSTIRTRG